MGSPAGPEGKRASVLGVGVILGNRRAPEKRGTGPGLGGEGPKPRDKG